MLGGTHRVGLEPDARVGSARRGRLDWEGRQPVTRLAVLEAQLLRSAIAAGVRMEFNQNARALAVTEGGWRLDVEAGPTFEADLLIDASGAHRAVFALLDDRAPDVPLDDIEAPERHISWQGHAAPDDPCLIAWADQAVEGLLQVDSQGRVQLTARAGAGTDLTLASVEAAMRAAGGEALAKRLVPIQFDPRGVRHTSPGARRVALDEVDLSGLPPLALIGDALIEAPPRYGEGIGRAVEHALMLEDLLRGGRAAECAAQLARQAKTRWAGYGVALSLRPTSMTV